MTLRGADRAPAEWLRQSLTHRSLRTTVGDHDPVWPARADHRSGNPTRSSTAQLVYQIGHGGITPGPDIARSGPLT